MIIWERERERERERESLLNRLYTYYYHYYYYSYYYYGGCKNIITVFAAAHKRWLKNLHRKNAREWNDRVYVSKVEAVGVGRRRPV